MLRVSRPHLRCANLASDVCDAVAERCVAMCVPPEFSRTSASECSSKTGHSGHYQGQHGSNPNSRGTWGLVSSAAQGSMPQLSCMKAAGSSPRLPYDGVRVHSRGFAASNESLNSVDEAIFHKASNATLDQISENLEILLDDIDLDGSDIEYSQGVLTLKLGSLGTFVLNKQTPNRQLWMSSPVSGPFRYDLHDGTRWVYRHNGSDLVKQLEEELSQLLGKKVTLE